MNRLRSLRIGTRIALLAAALLLCLFGVSAMALLQVSRIQANVNDLGDNWLPSVQALGRIGDLANTARRVTFRHVLASTDGARQELTVRHDKIIQADMPQALAAYAPLVSSPEERRLFEAIQSQWTAYVDVEKALLLASAAGEDRHQEARGLADGPSNKAFLAFAGSVSQAIELNARGADEAKRTAATTLHRTVALLTGLMVLALALGVGLTWLISRSIVRPLRVAVDRAGRVAQGDLSKPVGGVPDGQDEASQLLAALEDMRSSLATIVGEVRDSSETIATGTSQIAVGNLDLSRRTESQASNLQHTSGALTQLTGTVASSVDSAQSASTLAHSAASIAERGGSVVAQVVSTMDGINASSKRIGEIIGVIDGIAFQTNILALNAAVEAARAGEQGRGFAVVASEVRSLAQRSAEAAREIKVLIGASVDRVEAGARQVQDAGNTMNEIVVSVGQVSQVIAAISGTAGEQNQGIQQVNESVRQLDQMTQENAALVEQSAAAAESLRVQSQHLAQLVRIFKIEGS